MTMNINRDDIKIKIKILNSETILAQATVILFDVWEEHGWKVLKSNKIHPAFQEEIWIQAPSYRSSGEWKEMVFIDDRKLFELVQEKIYDTYRMAKNKKEGLEAIKQNEVNKETNKETTEIDYDKIPL